MWIYQKHLQYPVRVDRPNPALAKVVVAQYGGPDGELGASLRYLTQRYTMPMPEARAALTDIGTEELAHMEIVGTLVYNLLKGASLDEIKKAGMDGYYTNHDRGVFYVDPNGIPWSAAGIQCKGDPIADLTEDLSAEEKARATYDYLLNLSDDPGVTDTLRFLRAREVVHFQRFGELLQLLYDRKNSKSVW